MKGSRFRATAGSLSALLALLVALAFASSAMAAPTLGPSGSAFYTPPSPLPSGTNGTLISYRPSTINLGTGAPAVSAWDMLYYTTDAVGAQDLATGSVIVPTAAWTGSGSRPVIDYAVGTQGLAQTCAPSAQLAAGTEYENANIVAALKQGWAVVISDYQGYTTGSQSLYTVGAAEGHAVLDAVTAADQVPSVGISSSTKVAIWGYSQGGQAAAWAGQLQPTYDSSMNLVGVAAGGIPGDLEATANYLNGSTAAGFAAMAIVGLSDQYPNDIPIGTLENANGAAAIANIKTQCVFATLEQYENVNLDAFTQGGETLAQLEATPAIGTAITDQQLGLTKISVPVYQYHGQADEIVPLAQDIALKQAYCSLGVTDEFALYPGEHITTQFQASPQVISWITNRFGLLGTLNAPNDCSESAPVPTSTANPGGGDFVVSLNKWQLGATLKLKNFGGTVTLPSTSTFSGNTDLTSKTLNAGTIVAPSFSSALTFIGIPVTATISLAQVGQASGTASLDTSGQLHISGLARETVGLSAVNLFGINIATGATCQTVTPVQFPLTFNGPVSSLGDGQLTFSGTTTFPQLANCGAFTGILNLLFPGAGNTYSFTVSPPAPVNY